MLAYTSHNKASENQRLSVSSRNCGRVPIGVNADAQGKGVGKALLAETEKQIGIEKLSLTTDYYNNESTIVFYQKCGYKVLYVFTAYPDRKMLRMIKEL